MEWAYPGCKYCGGSIFDTATDSDKSRCFYCKKEMEGKNEPVPLWSEKEKIGPKDKWGQWKGVQDPYEGFCSESEEDEDCSDHEYMHGDDYTFGYGYGW